MDDYEMILGGLTLRPAMFKGLHMPEKMPTIGQLVWGGLTGLIGIAVSLGGWYLRETATTLKSIDDRVAAIELWKAEVSGNRFTAKDGAEVWKTIADAKTTIATLQANQIRVMADVSKLDDLIRGQSRIEARLDAMEKSINRHMDAGKVSAMIGNAH